MTFVRLGLTNAWRNLARSLFAIITMGLACSFLTYSISLSRGYTQLQKADGRSVLGGEIVVYARQFGGVIPQGESNWMHSFIESSPNSDLAIFHPELLDSGYLHSHEQKNRFSLEDQQLLATSLSGITFVYPRYQLPAVTVDHTRQATPLHGRDPALDRMQAKHPSELIDSGRWLTEEDEGALVAVVNQYVRTPEGIRAPRVGDIITVEVPMVRYINGEPVYQNARTKRYELKIVGTIAISTRKVNQVDILWDLAEIQIPMATWHSIWKDIGGQDYSPEELTLGYKDLSHLEDTVMELRMRFPQFTINSSVEHIAQAERRGIIERTDLSISLKGTQNTEYLQQAMPLDLRVPFVVIIFINAAMVVASQLLIVANERKDEIGILKAVGAKRSEIVVMVLAECLLISLVGASLGFAFFRFPAMLTELTNGLNAAVIVLSILQDAVIVFGIAFSFSLIFGLLPGLRTASLSVMEALQQE